jgi:hypothetical protein
MQPMREGIEGTLGFFSFRVLGGAYFGILSFLFFKRKISSQDEVIK